MQGIHCQRALWQSERRLVQLGQPLHSTRVILDQEGGFQFRLIKSWDDR